MRVAKRLNGPLGTFLAPLGWLYGAVAALRVHAYRKGWKASKRPPLPTLSIGNISAGGTGKTPLLLEALRWLAQHDATVGVLSRGYGGDEGILLRNRFPTVSLVEDPDRRRGLQTLLSGGRPEVLLLDDGFQHLKLQRDVDVVLMDATCPFGRCLPAGLFRERLTALARADLVILSRVDLVDQATRDTIWQRVAASRPGLPTPRVEGRMAPSVIRSLEDQSEQNCRGWQGREVGLAAGIGNPDSFRVLAEELGMVVRAEHRLPDHHPWTPELVQKLKRGDIGGWKGPWLVTEKDAVKIDPGTKDFFELLVDWEFVSGAEDFHQHLAALHLPARAARIEPLWAAHDPEGKGH